MIWYDEFDSAVVFLGAASSSKYEAEGVCNPYSQHGNNYGPESIFNPYGEYGSEYSAKSAYNKYTTTPPVIACVEPEGIAFLNPVSVNSIVADAIHPDTLCVVLEANGY